jgi:selenocysteine-specific elongation factor
MDMKHQILGTAGHVDHGKTSLVKALCGIDCDTHPEEKRRGITINQGFAHLDLPSGRSLGIVDVPGHNDFIHNMVAGITGIDLVVLVVAADDGVMPQTIEHLRIMDCLGIRSGLVALTKSDLLGDDDELREMACAEIREALAGTFLEGCPILPVSSLTGAGLPQLRDAIAALAEATPARPEGAYFRMFIDRVFGRSGHGTVVTGTALGGRLARDQEARLLPGDHPPLRIRRMERHGQDVAEVAAGDRVALNLPDLDRDRCQRGMVIADHHLPDTRLVDASLRLFSPVAQARLWTTVVFHLGTYQSQARIHRIGEADDGGALVQIHLDAPLVAQVGDRFIVRSTSGAATLGGGAILDICPLHHRRRTEKAVAALRQLAGADLSALVEAQVRKLHDPAPAEDVALLLGIALADLLAADPGAAVTRLGDGPEAIFLLRERWLALRTGALRSLAAHHRRHPLLATGRTRDELVGSLGLLAAASGPATVSAVMADLEAAGEVRREAGTWVLAGHRVEIDPATRADLDFLEQWLAAAGMQVPLVSEIQAPAARRGIDDKRFASLLHHLVAARRAYHIEGEWLHAGVVDRCRRLLIDRLRAEPAGLTVAAFRDLVDGNRKICLLLMALFDREGTTRRQGDVRVLDPRCR